MKSILWHCIVCFVFAFSLFISAQTVTISGGMLSSDLFPLAIGQNYSIDIRVRYDLEYNLPANEYCWWVGPIHIWTIDGVKVPDMTETAMVTFSSWDGAPLHEIGTHNIACYVSGWFIYENGCEWTNVITSPVCVGTIQVDTYEFDYIGDFYAGEPTPFPPDTGVCSAGQQDKYCSRKAEDDIIQHIQYFLLTQGDYQQFFPVETIPDGYGILMDGNSNEGTITKLDDGRFKYDSPLEQRGDWNVQKCIDVNASFMPSRSTNPFSKSTFLIKLYSVFEYLKTKNRCIGSIRYANWKYYLQNQQFYTSENLGYDPSLVESAKTTMIGNIIYVNIGPNGITSEWTCASTLWHELYHARAYLGYVDPANSIEEECFALETELIHSNAPTQGQVNPLTYLYTQDQDEYYFVRRCYISNGGKIVFSD